MAIALAGLDVMILPASQREAQVPFPGGPDISRAAFYFCFVALKWVEREVVGIAVLLQGCRFVRRRHCLSLESDR